MLYKQVPEKFLVSEEEMAAQTTPDVQFALACMRKFYFDAFKATADPDSLIDFANGTRAPSFAVFLPATMEDDEEDLYPEGCTYAQIFTKFLRVAEHDVDLCRATKILKLAPEQKNEVPESHQRTRFFMHLKHALASSPVPEHPSSTSDLGERCDLELHGHVALPHISPPFSREAEYPEYDKYWSGIEELMTTHMCWLGALLCAFPDTEIGMTVDCPVCTETATLVENLHALDINAYELATPPHDTPPELMKLLVKAECAACGLMHSALHPRAAIAYTGISMRSD